MIDQFYPVVNALVGVIIGAVLADWWLQRGSRR